MSATLEATPPCDTREQTTSALIHRPLTLDHMSAQSGNLLQLSLDHRWVKAVCLLTSQLDLIRDAEVGVGRVVSAADSTRFCSIRFPCAIFAVTSLEGVRRPRLDEEWDLKAHLLRGI